VRKVSAWKRTAPENDERGDLQIFAMITMSAFSQAHAIDNLLEALRLYQKGIQTILMTVAPAFVLAKIVPTSVSNVLSSWPQPDPNNTEPPEKYLERFFEWTSANSVALSMALGWIAFRVVMVDSIVYASMIRVAADLHFDRQNNDVVSFWKRSCLQIIPMFLSDALMGLSVGVGIVFLLVPGLYLSSVLAFVHQIIVVENRSMMQSFERSSNLTRGCRWSIMGVTAGLLLGQWLLTTVLGSVFVFDGDLVEILFVEPLNRIFWTQRYFELRVEKENADAETFKKELDNTSRLPLDVVNAGQSYVQRDINELRDVNLLDGDTTTRPTQQSRQTNGSSTNWCLYVLVGLIGAAFFIPLGSVIWSALREA